MTQRDPLVSTLHDARQRFLELVAEVRPDLHRYCARMTGSVADGEDIVQETLARAYYALAEVETLPPLRPWLFSIAHNRALDWLRRYDRRMGQPLEAASNASDAGDDPEDALARDEATRAAITRFSELVPLQRSCVILKDVLGHSVEEMAALLELSPPAVKAALHRGRDRLRALAESAPRDEMPAPPPTSPAVARYVALFNARDWTRCGRCSRRTCASISCRACSGAAVATFPSTSRTTTASTIGIWSRRGSPVSRSSPSSARRPTRARPISSS
jgi:RNA polymerase sigma-70 factor (ECF subfamily)